MFTNTEHKRDWCCDSRHLGILGSSQEAADVGSYSRAHAYVAQYGGLHMAKM